MYDFFVFLMTSKLSRFALYLYDQNSNRCNSMSENCCQNKYPILQCAGNKWCFNEETPCKNMCLFLLKNFHEHHETTHFLRLGIVDEFNHVFFILW